jgi:hypothetical protein
MTSADATRFGHIPVTYFDLFLAAPLDFLAARARARTFFITRRSVADILITSDNI